jgi:hypothetical protein
VVAPGMHRVARLEQYDAYGRGRPVDALRRLVGEGPIGQLYLLGWWSTYNVFFSQLDHAMSTLVGGHLFLRLPESDVQAVYSPHIQYTAEAHRALYWDRAQGVPPTTMVPFGLPSDADLRRLGGGW